MTQSGTREGESLFIIFAQHFISPLLPPLQKKPNQLHQTPAQTLFFLHCEGCFKKSQSSSYRRRHGKAISGGGFVEEAEAAPNGLASSSSSTRTRLTRLLASGQTRAVTSGLRMRKGEHLYGRLELPWSSSPLTLAVVASWGQDGFYQSPLWMFIKRAGSRLPSTSDYDKT